MFAKNTVEGFKNVCKKQLRVLKSSQKYGRVFKNVSNNVWGF